LTAREYSTLNRGVVIELRAVICKVDLALHPEDASVFTDTALLELTRSCFDLGVCISTEVKGIRSLVRYINLLKV
jgi:hypothetical protein